MKLSSIERVMFTDPAQLDYDRKPVSDEKVPEPQTKGDDAEPEKKVAEVDQPGQKRSARSAPEKMEGAWPGQAQHIAKRREIASKHEQERLAAEEKKTAEKRLATEEKNKEDAEAYT